MKVLGENMYSHRYSCWLLFGKTRSVISSRVASKAGLSNMQIRGNAMTMVQRPHVYMCGNSSMNVLHTVIRQKWN